jgi:hypothetical protein
MDTLQVRDVYPVLVYDTNVKIRQTNPLRRTHKFVW